MLGELIAVDMDRVERSDLINGSIERDTRLKGGNDIIDGDAVRLGSPIPIDDEGRAVIEDRLAVGFGSVFAALSIW